VRLPAGRGLLALTVDLSAGVDPGVVRRAVTKLREHGMAATWFATGTWAERNGRLLEELARSGQCLGNHGHDHACLRGLGRQRSLEDIRRAAAAIKAAGGVTTRYFRPPFGESDAAVAEAAAMLGHRVVLGGIDSLDWHSFGVKASLSHVLGQPLDGAIVSMHANADRFWPLLDRLAAELVIRSLRSVTLDQGLA
jgi:peptidoglycan/xylan/chitin deacetylase (PgdA/CDA1 family)